MKKCDASNCTTRRKIIVEEDGMLIEISCWENCEWWIDEQVLFRI